MDNEKKIIEKIDELKDSLNDFKLGQAKKVTKLETKMNGLLWGVGVFFVSSLEVVRDFFK